MRVVGSLIKRPDSYIAEFDLVAVTAKADVAAGSLQAGVLVAVESLWRAGLLDVSIDDSLAVELYLYLFALCGYLLEVPFANGF